LYFLSIFQPFFATVASIAAFAVGVTEMMYLAFAPRSMAEVGTIVELSEKIVSNTINDARNLALEILSIRAPWVVHAMSDNMKILRFQA
jgi:hypothetical protein